MFFASDNTGPVHPKIMERIIAANHGPEMPYGTDVLMNEVRKEICDLFDAPEATVYLVVSGTAANSRSLACNTQPWQTVFCTQVAHISADECNAPEFYSGGAKLTLVPSTGKMTPHELTNAIEGKQAHGVHCAQRGLVSIT